MKKLRFLTAAACALILCGTQAEAAASAKPVKPSKEVEQSVGESNGYKFKVGTGFDYSSGNYGSASNTEIWYVPVTGKVERDNWTLKLTIPWLSITGPGAVVGGGGTGVTRAPAVVTTTESGLGDMVGSLGYSLELPNAFFVDVTGKIKFPTGDFNKGLGTGEADYTGLIDITKQIGIVSLFAGGGYKITGTNSTLNLHNVPLANVGAGIDATPQLNLGTSYDWRESASGRDNPSESTFYANYKLTKQINVQGYGVVGYSDGSPDYGIGLMLGYKFQ
ncbi:MAG: hypothetical protein SFW65_07735 [Alphaproteobacteria bacterium]|nr:hypothetical protein [Alphaproteobacteria bacterium]